MVRPELEALSELNDAEFFDADFPPTQDSLTVLLSVPRWLEHVVQWKRVDEALPDATLFPENGLGKMQCGKAIDDVWLANALVTVQQRPALLRNIFASVENADQVSFSTASACGCLYQRVRLLSQGCLRSDAGNLHAAFL